MQKTTHRQPLLFAAATLLLALASVPYLSDRGTTVTAQPNAAPVPASAKIEDVLAQGQDSERNGDHAAAGEHYRKATEQWPQDARAWAHFGEYLRFFSLDSAQAEIAFRQALAAEQRDPAAIAFAWRGLGDLAATRGDYKQAIELLKKSLAIRELSDTHRSLCHVYGFMREFDNATLHSQAAVALEPEDPIAHLLNAIQLKRCGKSELARAAFLKGIEFGGCDEQGKSDGPVHCCVYLNAAGYYGVAADKAGVLCMLESFFKTPNHRHISREHLLADPDFIAYVNDAEFLALIEKYLGERN
jgi:tetratricopeptide (TPR) repeat protein